MRRRNRDFLVHGVMVALFLSLGAISAQAQQLTPPRATGGPSESVELELTVEGEPGRFVALVGALAPEHPMEFLVGGIVPDSGKLPLSITMPKTLWIQHPQMRFGFFTEGMESPHPIELGSSEDFFWLRWFLPGIRVCISICVAIWSFPRRYVCFRFCFTLRWWR